MEMGFFEFVIALLATAGMLAVAIGLAGQPRQGQHHIERARQHIGRG